MLRDRLAETERCLQAAEAQARSERAALEEQATAAAEELQLLRAAAEEGERREAALREALEATTQQAQQAAQECRSLVQALQEREAALAGQEQHAAELQAGAPFYGLLHEALSIGACGLGPMRDLWPHAQRLRPKLIRQAVLAPCRPSMQSVRPRCTSSWPTRPFRGSSSLQQQSRRAGRAQQPQRRPRRQPGRVRRRRSGSSWWSGSGTMSWSSCGEQVR